MWLKTIRFLSSHRLPASEFQHILTGCFTQSRRKLDPSRQALDYSSGVLTWESYLSQLPQVVCKIHFPADGRRLRSLLPCWLWARQCSQLLKAMHSACSAVCLNSREFPSCPVLFALHISLIPFCYHPKKTTFKGLMWLYHSHPHNPIHWKAIDFGLHAFKILSHCYPE